MGKNIKEKYSTVKIIKGKCNTRVKMKEKRLIREKQTDTELKKKFVGIERGTK